MRMQQFAYTSFTEAVLKKSEINPDLTSAILFLFNYVS